MICGQCRLLNGGVFMWLRGRVRDRRQGAWSGPQGTERTRATLR